jgi:hypothetical protein
MNWTPDETVFMLYVLWVKIKMALLTKRGRRFEEFEDSCEADAGFWDSVAHLWGGGLRHLGEYEGSSKREHVPPG